MHPDFKRVRDRLVIDVARAISSPNTKEYVRTEVDRAIQDIDTGYKSGFARLEAVKGRGGDKLYEELDEAIAELHGIVASRRTTELNKRAFRGKVDIAVICALGDPELAAVFGMFEDKPVEYDEWQDDPHMAFFGRFVARESAFYEAKRDLTVVAAQQDETGMVDCAILAGKMIREWKPRYLVMTGICGGNPEKNVQLGDVIVPSSILTYQTGKYLDGVFQWEPRRVGIDSGLKRRVEKCRPWIGREIVRMWKEPDRTEPSVLTDLLACGDAVVDEEGKMNEIAEMHRKIVGVDMESYAIGRAAELYSEFGTVPLVIKGVSDFAFGKSETSDQEFAAFASACFLYHFALAELV